MNKNFEPEFGVDSDRDYRDGLNNAARTNSESSNDTIIAADPTADAPSELPLHPAQPAAEPDDAGVARAELHPVEWPAPPLSSALSGDRDAARELEDFARFVAAMREKDYGDWMRRANVYWEALRDNLLRIANPRDTLVIEAELGRLKNEIQYRPNWDIAETQKDVVKKALELRRYFGGDDSIDIHDLEISTSVSKCMGDDFEVVH